MPSTRPSLAGRALLAVLVSLGLLVGGPWSPTAATTATSAAAQGAATAHVARDHRAPEASRDEDRPSALGADRAGLRVAAGRGGDPLPHGPAPAATAATTWRPHLPGEGTAVRRSLSTAPGGTAPSGRRQRAPPA